MGDDSSNYQELEIPLGENVFRLMWEGLSAMHGSHEIETRQRAWASSGVQNAVARAIARAADDGWGPVVAPNGGQLELGMREESGFFKTHTCFHFAASATLPLSRSSKTSASSSEGKTLLIGKYCLACGTGLPVAASFCWSCGEKAGTRF